MKFDTERIDMSYRREKNLDIHLEYKGGDFIEWDVPGFCSIKNKSAPETVMFCQIQGIYNIKPKIRGQPLEAEERFLFVDRSSDCFLWYFQESDLEKEDSQLIRLWIYDPENASPAELSGNAGTPSINSKSLSMQFISMGQEPAILSTITNINYPTYVSTQEGIWTSKIPQTKKNLFMKIKGNSVAFQDCFIADFMFLLSHIKLTFSQHPEYVPITSNNEEIILFDWPPCYPSTVVTVSFWETLFTKDAFNTSEKIRIPPNILTDEERGNIKDISLIDEGIVILTGGSLYLRTTDDFIKLDERFGIPDNLIAGTETRTWCWTEYTPREGLELSQIVVWTTTEVFLGYSKLKFYKLANISQLRKIMHIHSRMEPLLSMHLCTYTSDPTGVALMIRLKINKQDKDMLFLVFYNEDTLKWELQDFSMFFPAGKTLNALFMFSALPNFVIWDDKTVYYSYQNYSHNGYLLTPSRQSDLTTLTKNSSIHQLFIDYYGNAVIKMYNNMMLYFKLDITDVALLHEWTTEHDNTLLLINPTGELFLANLNYGIAQFSEYPLMLELYSSTYKEQTICPYMSFESSLGISNVYLDKKDELTFWCQVVYPENLGVFAIVEIYGPKILKEKRNVDYEIALGICTKNLTVTFYQGIDYEAADNYKELQEKNMGRLMVQLRPSQFAKTCPLSNQAIHVFVGCYTGRHIRVKGLETECESKNFTYEIEKKYLEGKPTENKQVFYQTKKYGCPLKLHMYEHFHPVLLLYDGDKLIEEIKENFIIWEINGRKDFTYSMSMYQAGCINEAQSWDSMKKINKDLPKEKVWGPENYRHCFSFSIGKPGDLSQPYEIINLSNKNEIIWTNHHVGFYVFRVKIIDPNYSFCDLTTNFAIETFGVIPSTDPLLVFIFLLLLVLLIIVCLIGSYFRYLKIFRKFIYEPSLRSKSKKKEKN
ncbi:cation channel sperm-associated protein subunit epsilon [Dromiciops gliroides]|uniref:cation channel sperm-associated protein subunit epsilon n=1 Tax=Dromiciops gliroides TaxID=33562 RepID=UPI001CC6BE43|nr:cation channel sperm-associated protein subunit epsilon [Dromiciops gliroides]